MEIGKKFNKLTKKEYFFYIENRKKYTDFNTLGLYRSLHENEKLSLEDKIELRDYANTLFGKTFEFLQIKAPYTYFKLITLGKEINRSDEFNLWGDIRKNQERILKEKKIKHRNFGEYSKHECGYEQCPLNGIMTNPNSAFAEYHMTFHSDKNSFSAKEKSKRIKKERRNKKRIIDDAVDGIYWDDIDV